mmetsp:Transcript_5129/g.11159  ORF Transcript_5129/g.11159 Transcript_5129/m.11159 type:complete len:134 (-) Transcript_5129:2053-2454(-)
MENEHSLVCIHVGSKHSAGTHIHAAWPWPDHLPAPIAEQAAYPATMYTWAVLMPSRGLLIKPCCAAMHCHAMLRACLARSQHLTCHAAAGAAYGAKASQQHHTYHHCPWSLRPSLPASGLTATWHLLGSVRCQ